MTTEETMEETMEQQGEITARQLEENLAGEAEEEIEEAQDDLQAQVRQGIGELFQDGWSEEELLDFSRDAQARRDVAGGMSVSRAACAYLRRALEAQQRLHKRGVPTVRHGAADGADEGERIERMTDEQFDAFSRKARAAMMAGRSVRL